MFPFLSSMFSCIRCRPNISPALRLHTTAVSSPRAPPDSISAARAVSAISILSASGNSASRCSLVCRRAWMCDATWRIRIPGRRENAQWCMGSHRARRTSMSLLPSRASRVSTTGPAVMLLDATTP